MTKKLIIVAFVLLLLALVMTVAVLLDSKDVVDSVATTGSAVTEPTVLTTVPDTTGDEMMAGVEDSIFGEQEETSTEAPAETIPAETKPVETESNQNDSGNQQQGSSGAEQKPETESPKPTEAPEKPKPTEPPKAPGKMSYEQYQDMSAGDQRAYMDSFSSIEAFFDWYNAAKEKYEAEHPAIEVGDEPIDLGQVVGGNG